MVTETTGSPMPGGIDLNSLLQSAIAGGTMSDLFGGKSDGGNLVSGLLLGMLAGRNGLFGDNGNGNGWDNNGNFNNPNVAQPQANMSLMAGIGDIKQAVAVAAEAMIGNNAAQTGQIQNQLSGVAAALTNTVTMAKDSATQNTITLMQQLNATTTTLMNDGDKTRAVIADLAERLPSARELDLQRQLAVAQEEERFRRLSAIVDSGNITVTNNLNQNQQQQQQQQLLVNMNNSLASILPYLQNIGQSVVNLGTMTGAAGQQTAANTRVSA
jgi:hypothetical protein